MAPWLAVMQDARGPVINLYEPADASITLADKSSVILSIAGNYPVSGDVTVAVNPAKRSNFSIKLRMPGWSKKTHVAVNGQAYEGVTGTYLSIARDWNPGDVIKIKFDMGVRINAAPDGDGRVALTYGPIVLAQDSRLGKVDAPISTDHPDACVLARNPRKDIWMLFRLADGTELCDYASAGNEFSKRNPLCVWMTRSADK